jgi:hypothetical protein
MIERFCVINLLPLFHGDVVAECEADVDTLVVVLVFQQWRLAFAAAVRQLDLEPFRGACARHCSCAW